MRASGANGHLITSCCVHVLSGWWLPWMAWLRDLEWAVRSLRLKLWRSLRSRCLLWTGLWPAVAWKNKTGSEVGGLRVLESSPAGSGWGPGHTLEPIGVKLWPARGEEQMCDGWTSHQVLVCPQFVPDALQCVSEASELCSLRFFCCLRFLLDLNSTKTLRKKRKKDKSSV